MTENKTHGKSTFSDERWEGVVRPYTQKDVERLRGSVKIEYTLADLWALPMLTYLRLAPTGRTLLAGFPKLGSWLDVIGKRPSAVATRFPLELKSAGEILGGA